MFWTEITVKTTSSAIELLGAKLTMLGYDSYIIDDAEDFARFLEENRQYWDYVDEDFERNMRGLSQIRFFLDSSEDAASVISTLQSELAELAGSMPDISFGSLEISSRTVKNEDWENSWKQYYQPISAGKRLMIVPQWLSPENPENRLQVRLDPGMIFGTGAHASTQMCLAALDQYIRGGEQLLDLGCGSGILSISALKLGASSAFGVDIDPKAKDIAMENAALNGYGEPEFSAAYGNVLDQDFSQMLQLRGKYQIITANIVADVIIALAPAVPSLLDRNGYFICSGILDIRRSEVMETLTKYGFEICSSMEQNGWCCFVCCQSK